MIRFWAILVRFSPPSGHKMTENCGLRPLSEKVLTQSNSNLVCILIGCVSTIDSLLGHKFWPSSGHKMTEIQTWWVHLFGECPELGRFWGMLSKVCPPRPPPQHLPERYSHILDIGDATSTKS